MGINAVVKSGLEREANQLKLDSCSDQKIANELSKISGKKISRSAVFRYFESHKEAIQQVVEKSELLALKAVNKNLDIADTLVENISQLDSALKGAVEDRAWVAVSKLLAERRMNAEAAAKITGMLQGDNTIVNIQNETKITGVDILKKYECMFNPVQNSQ